MAKDKKKKEEGAPEGENSELQVPETPKKKYSDLNMKSVIVIIAGALIFVVLVIFALYWFLIRPDIIGKNTPEQGQKSVQVEVVTDEETLKFNEELAKIKAQAKAGVLKELKFAQTADIITNTNPPDWYVVLQIGVEYKDVMAAEGGGGHGGGGDALPPKLASEISSVVTKFCGSKPIESVLSVRDSLDVIFFKELEPIFTKEKIFLHKISIPKFVTQRA